MDAVLANTLRASLKTAKTTGAKIDAVVTSLIAVVDCQLSNAEKIKGLVQERNDWRARISGVQLVFTAVKWVSGSGVLVAVLKLAKAGII